MDEADQFGWRCWMEGGTKIAFGALRARGYDGLIVKAVEITTGFVEIGDPFVWLREVSITCFVESTEIQLCNGRNNYQFRLV
jgi:hypothetical protein